LGLPEFNESETNAAEEEESIHESLKTVASRKLQENEHIVDPVFMYVCPFILIDPVP
jgi:hypothetical protein